MKWERDNDGVRHRPLEPRSRSPTSPLCSAGNDLAQLQFAFALTLHHPIWIQAAGVADFTASLPRNPGSLPQRVNEELRALTGQVLLDFPGVEGGFYFVAADRFGGFAHPSGPPSPKPQPPRNDPPPLEAGIIRAQALQSAGLPADEFTVSVQDVGPSRVAILTEAVGERRPALLVTWVLFRITSREQLERRLRTFAVSSALSLGGIILALALSWNLGRSLQRQRQQEERLRDDLRRAEHLAALGKLLAGVAHEVRNPLAGIRSTVQLWQRLCRARASRSSSGVRRVRKKS